MSAGAERCSIRDVDGVPKRSKDRFVGHLRHGGVRMDGAGDVLEQRAHLKRKGPLPDEFSDVCSNALYAKHAVVVFPGYDADEARGLLGFHRQGTAGPICACRRPGPVAPP